MPVFFLPVNRRWLTENTIMSPDCRKLILRVLLCLFLTQCKPTQAQIIIETVPEPGVVSQPTDSGSVQVPVVENPVEEPSPAVLPMEPGSSAAAAETPELRRYPSSCGRWDVSTYPDPNDCRRYFMCRFGMVTHMQ